MIDEDTMGGEVLREGDKILGDVFAEAYDHQLITKGEWAAANRCRLTYRLCR